MKKMIALLLAALMLLSACGTPAAETPVEETPVPPADMIAQVVVIAMGGTFEYMRKIHEAYDDADFTNYVEGYYGLAPEVWDDCAIYMAENAAEAFEITVFHLTEQADTNSVMECLEEYRLNRQGDFFGYNPEQAEIVENSVIAFSDGGTFASVLICQNAENAEKAFSEAVKAAGAAMGYAENGIEATVEPTTEPTTEPTVGLTPEPDEEPENSVSTRPKGAKKYISPGREKHFNAYDNSAILAAWESGSSDALTEEEKAVYYACCELLPGIINESMSDYEKEWAIYSWIINNVGYDWTHYDNTVITPGVSYRPYGALINNVAVCLGYAACFELLAALAGFECITVMGAAFSSTENHAWNMIKLDGEWYCVDATWDHGSKPSPEYCEYFNVTSEYMALTDHQWDYDNVPMATAEDGGK